MGWKAGQRATAAASAAPTIAVIVSRESALREAEAERGAGGAVWKQQWQRRQRRRYQDGGCLEPICREECGAEGGLRLYQVIHAYGPAEKASAE